jgi:O-antigen ligase
MQFVHDHRFVLVPSRSLLPLLGLNIVAALAFLNGQLPWFWNASKAPMTAQLGGLFLFILSTVAFLLTANQIKSQTWLERMTWIFLFAGWLYLLGRLIPPVGQITNRIISGGATGSLFWVWFVSLSFSQALVNIHLKIRYRFLLVCLLFGAFYVAFIESRDWVSGWLPPLIALLVILWLATPKLRPVFVVLALGICAIRFNQLAGLVMGGDNQYSLMTRQQAWGILGEMVKVSPLFGLGPANYHFYTPLFPILGYSVQFNSHNQYIDLLAQVGILGLACFLWFAWELGREGLQLMPRVPAGFPKAYLVGALGGLAGTLAAGMLGDWIIPFVYNIGFEGFRASILAWIFLGGMVALRRMALRNLSTS